MIRKEKINRNIGLTFDFFRQVIDDPSIINNIPDGATLEFVEKDFSIKSDVELNDKYIIKVKNVFERIIKLPNPSPNTYHIY